MARFKLYTEGGHDLMVMASMLQKSIRRMDAKHAGIAAREMSGKYRNYLWKRLLVISAEDCYGIMTTEIKHLYDSDKLVNVNGKNTRVFIAKAVTLLLYARKNRDADYFANSFMQKSQIIDDDSYINLDDEQLLEQIPDYVYDVHTTIGRKRGKTKLQFFADEEQSLTPKQTGLFGIDDLKLD